MLREIIYKHLVHLFNIVFNCRKKNNVILFESYPELDGSPWMIYQALKQKGYDQKYKLIWATDSSYKSKTNIKCIPFFGKLNLWQAIHALYYQTTAKIIIDSNRPIYKTNPHSIRIFTRHGGTLKKCTDYMRSLGEMNYLLTLSCELQNIDYQDCGDYCLKNLDNILILGLPANDKLFEQIDLFSNGFYPRLSSQLSRKQIKKVIGWLPTYRQHRNDSTSEATKHFPYGVPLIQTDSELISLNHLLEEKNILLAIQMHHAQMENFSKKSFSNIVLITQDIKYEMNISTANLMQSFDALITDYSAAYHEYILLDRPIALSIDDYEEYAKNPGFSVDYFDLIKGVYLKNFTDLTHFVEDISNGIDSAKNEREKAKFRIHKYTDNQSTKRVVDFLIEKVKL